MMSAFEEYTSQNSWIDHAFRPCTGGGRRGGEEGNGIDNRNEKVRQQGWGGGQRRQPGGMAGQTGTYNLEVISAVVGFQKRKRLQRACCFADGDEGQMT